MGFTSLSPCLYNSLYWHHDRLLRPLCRILKMELWRCRSSLNLTKCRKLCAVDLMLCSHFLNWEVCDVGGPSLQVSCVRLFELHCTKRCHRLGSQLSEFSEYVLQRALKLHSITIQSIGFMIFLKFFPIKISCLRSATL